MSLQPDKIPPPVHPEMLANIPHEWKDPLVEFVTTGRTDAPGFDDFLDSSAAAQAVVDQAFRGTLRAVGQQHLQRLERTGSSFLAAEDLAEQSGLSLDQAMNLESFMSTLAERVQSEQRELEEEC